MDNGRSLESEIEKLNRYLGIRTESDLLAALYGGDGISEEELKNEKVRRVFQSLASIRHAGGYVSIESLVAALSDLCDTSPALGQDSIAKRLKSSSDHPLLSITTWEGSDSNKFFLKKNGIKPIIEKLGTPSAKKGISVIEIHDHKLGFSNKDTLSATTFLQILPSVELSRAVPYFDAKLITLSDIGANSDTPLTPEQQARLFNNGVSIYRFLDGEITGADIPSKTISLSSISESDLINDNPLTFQKNRTVASSASMELFTSPQTLVSNQKYRDLNIVGMSGNIADTKYEDLALGDHRKSNIKDPFRPFMTWKAFNLDTTPATGMLSTKVATCTLTLHDIQRMAELAPLLTPSQLGNLEIQVEWGWSHPYGGTDSNVENIFASIINKMRIKEKYGVMNSSYSFTNDGQVEINLKLFTKGTHNIAFDMLQGTDSEHPADALQKAINAFRDTVQEIRGEGYNFKEDLSAPDTFGKASSIKGLLSLDSEELKAIKDFVANVRKSPTDGTIWTDFGNAFDNLEAVKKSFQQSVEEKIQKQINEITDSKGDDPWWVYPPGTSEGKVTLDGKTIVNVNPATHVSFAKFMTVILGNSIANVPGIDEVQMIFYPINDNATWASQLNVGQYPLSKAYLKDAFVGELKKRPSLQMQTLLNIIQKVFFNNVNDDIYGFSQFRSSTDRTQLAKTYSEDEASKKTMALKKRKILGLWAGDNPKPRFQKPNIAMHIECVESNDPVPHTVLRLHFIDKVSSSYSTYEEFWNATSKQEVGVIGAYRSAKNKAEKAKLPANWSKLKKDEQKKKQQLLDDANGRVANLAPMKTQAEKAFKEAGLIEPAKSLNGTEMYRIKGGPEQLRAVMAANVPTIKYGTEASGIISASIGTNSNPQMETIHMTRSRIDKGVPADDFDDGLPFRVKPANLDLEVFGCPLINFGQQFFVDFGTNSSLDDVYFVTGIGHTLSPTEFKTKIKLAPMQKFGQFQSLTDSLDALAAEAKEIASQTK